MNTTDAGNGEFPHLAAYEVVYSPIHGGCSFAFPCDEAGIVELNTLTERARDNYLLARALVGRDFYTPTVVRTWSGVAPGQGLP
ncbi:MAG TPA: hypothetical protein VFP68_14700 [Burkholderiaceae bacterium]|nr:hypothetical protein [Burkholderiaceae bacterium]